MSPPRPWLPTPRFGTALARGGITMFIRLFRKGKQKSRPIGRTKTTNIHKPRSQAIYKMSKANKQTQNKNKNEGQLEKISKYFTPSSKITERRQQTSEKPEVSDHESTAAKRHVQIKVK